MGDWVKLTKPVYSFGSFGLFFVVTQAKAQMAVAALATAGAAYLYMTSERQSKQEKQQRELEIEKERKLSSRLAAELVAAESNQNKLDWKATLERVVPAIVSLKLNSPKVGERANAVSWVRTQMSTESGCLLCGLGFIVL